MRQLLALSLLLGTLALTSCHSTGTLLPNISGKAGEVVVVMDRDASEGDLGAAVRNVIGGDCPYLWQKEPLYSIVNVTPGGFADMFKVHRNVVIFNIAPQVEKSGVLYRNDIWARPQCAIQINAADAQEALSLFNENQERILSTLEQAERDRVIANSKQYEDVSIADKVRSLFQGSPHFPLGYRVKKATDDFIWISDDKQYTIQGVFIYKYPADENENFTLENIIAHRNAVLKENVPGMREGSYMITSDAITPSIEFIRFRGRQLTQTRGYWDVQNDYMGGPFVSHSFYAPGGKDIIVVEAFVYAPKYDKRQYLRQVESIIYSFEWAEGVEQN